MADVVGLLWYFLSEVLDMASVALFYSATISSLGLASKENTIHLQWPGSRKFLEIFKERHAFPYQ
jgi:hypothetical protein